MNTPPRERQRLISLGAFWGLSKIVSRGATRVLATVLVGAVALLAAAALPHLFNKRILADNTSEQTTAIRAKPTNEPRPPILLPGVHEPNEMRVAPFPAAKTTWTAPERMLDER